MIGIPGLILAQDTLNKKELKKLQANYLLPGRPWMVEIPLWIPGYAGSFAYGDVSLEGEDGVDPVQPIEPPDGIWGNINIFSRLFKSEWYLRFFYLTKVTYEKNRLLGQFDAIYGSVGESVRYNYNDQTAVQANFRTTNFRLLGGYRIINALSENEKFQYELFGYLGARVHIQKIYSDLDGLINELNINPAWAEPIFGVQNQLTWKRWHIILQGDYGGYFMPSKSSAQITMFVYFRTGRLTSVKLGWNHLYLNQKGYILDEPYSIKATFSGPSAGLILHF